MSKKTNPSPELASLQSEISTLQDNWKRALADYQNLLRRVEHDKQQFTKIANANLIARLLPCLDILELSAVHSQDLGVQMAAKQFSQALIEEGLQFILPESGQLFDHQYHEAAEALPADAEHPQNTIAEIVLKGYKIGDYVLRPAKVKVYTQLEEASHGK